MNKLLKKAIFSICKERDRFEYDESSISVSKLLDYYGEKEIAERLFNEIPTFIPFEIVCNIFDILVWKTSDNGAEIQRTIEEWLKTSDDDRKILIALNLGAYPFIDAEEMDEVFLKLSERKPRFSFRCKDLSRKRKYK